MLESNQIRITEQSTLTVSLVPSQDQYLLVSVYQLKIIVHEIKLKVKS